MRENQLLPTNHSRIKSKRLKLLLFLVLVPLRREGVAITVVIKEPLSDGNPLKRNHHDSDMIDLYYYNRYGERQQDFGGSTLDFNPICLSKYADEMHCFRHLDGPK